ncbi:MAG: BTB/POZ domain-containing protein [Chlamydiia bacterium]|nr:BTB/POZ domain-containing protein [Chlamydiia bacterium]MCP5509464.1 BTB/POZ domain-containing protein [Chlamydiales bacterium]
MPLDNLVKNNNCRLTNLPAPFIPAINGRVFGAIVIKLHKCVLDVQGPEVLQGMLQASMAEAEQNTYNMDAWSEEAVELFVRNIYFGHQHVAHHLLSLDVIPKDSVFELLEMAHMYMQPGLFDCAANALSACASPDDLPRLLQLAEDTNSRFLLQLNDELGRPRQALELTKSIATLKV